MKMLDEKDYASLVDLLKDNPQAAYGIFKLKCRASDEQLVSSHEEAGVEQTLSRQDINLQDLVDRIVFDLFYDLTGEKPEWNIESIADLRDVIIDHIVERTDRTEYSLYPYTVTFEHSRGEHK